MTLNITVTIPEDDIKAGSGPQYLAKAMETIGFTRGVSLPMPRTAAQTEDELRDKITAVLDGAEFETEAASEAAAEPVKRGRLYGGPEDGKARRTKAQMAEDKQIEELAAEMGVNTAALADVEASVALERLRSGNGSAEAKPNSSTGEERIDPTSAEDKAQDAADEAAEAQATAGDAPTLDDLRQAAGRFQKKHGMAAAMEIIPDLLGCGLHEVADADIPASIAKLDGYEAAGDAPKESTPEPEPFEAARADVIEAMLQYAEKFDGQREDMNAMPIMTEDRVKIFNAAFGPDVDGLSKVPDNAMAYGKAVMAFREATEKNPFGREAK